MGTVIHETIKPRGYDGPFTGGKMSSLKRGLSHDSRHLFSLAKKTLSLVFLLIAAFSLRAQDQKQGKIYIELKPFQFISGGYSVVGHYALNDQWHIGTNVFSSQLSEGLNELVFNFDESIDLQANQNFAINVSLRYFLKNEGAKGWVLSAPIGYERWTLMDKNTDREVDYEYWYISPRIGYLWYPFKKERFYLIGEAIAVLPVITDGGVELGTNGIELRSFIPIPGFAFGYRF